MDSKTEMIEAIELLRWQLELGVDENIGNSPIDRFSEITIDPDPKKKKSTSEDQKMPKLNTAITQAESLAEQSENLDQLKNSLANYEFCDLKKGARNLVFSSGDPDANVMFVGEAPGREEDIQGIQSYDDLPPNCKKYVERIECLSNYPIVLLGTGPQRKSTIVRK